MSMRHWRAWGDNVAAVGKASQSLAPSLESLGTLANDLENAGRTEEAERLRNIAAQLAETAKDLDTGTSNLVESADMVRITFDSLADLSGRLPKAEESQAFKEGMKQCAGASNGTAAASRQLADGLDALGNGLDALETGTEELAEALFAVEEKARDLSAFSSLQEQGISPHRGGIRRLTDGLGELEQGSATLQVGSVVFRDNVQTFAAKMGEFKDKGMDEIDKKAGSLPEVKTILDTMSDLVKKDTSITCVGEGFQAKYRIVEKIK